MGIALLGKTRSDPCPGTLHLSTSIQIGISTLGSGESNQDIHASIRACSELAAALIVICTQLMPTAVATRVAPAVAAVATHPVALVAIWIALQRARVLRVRRRGRLSARCSEACAAACCAA